MTHIMADLETWGTSLGSHIRSIGAVVFDPVAGKLGSEFYVNIADAPGYGLTKDLATVKWWGEQSVEAQNALRDHRVDLLVGLMRFSNWMAEQEPDPEEIRIWAHGPTFDVSMLDMAYTAVRRSVPWHYRSPRDTRTILEAAGDGVGIAIPAYGVQHNALDDAKAQALAVIEAYRVIRANSHVHA